MGCTKEDALSYIRLEPRIRLIKRQLENILKLVDLEREGRTVKVTSFRLKNLSNWVGSTGSILDNLGSISGYCNADCEFCYEKENPIPCVKDNISLEEVKTRIKYYSLEKKLGLPTPSRFSFEVFCNPHFFDIIKAIRKVDRDYVFTITTNGGFLSENVIKKLSAFQPLMLCVSLNSANPAIRNKIMKETYKQTITAIESMPLLRKYKIIFIGSIVAWPSIPHNDIVETVKMLDKYDARIIRIALPGYSRYLSRQSLFYINKVWSGIVELVRNLRKKINTPIMCQPSFYWNEPLQPIVDGIIRYSPAECAGLKTGDTVIRINKEKVFTRVQAAKLLLDNYDKSKSCHLLISRNNKKFSINLKESSNNKKEVYPYRLKKGPVIEKDFGIFFIDDFRLNYIQQLISIIDEHNANNIILLSSFIMKPIIEKTITMVEDFKNYFVKKNLVIHIPPHSFWGGNIIMGDLYTVEDYKRYIPILLKNLHPKSDLVIIPASFATPWGFDLLGQSLTDLEDAFSVPVEFLNCYPIIR